MKNKVMNGSNMRIQYAWKLTFFVIWAAMAVGCLGCGSHPETAAVVGRVTVSGMPVTNCQIIFLPDKEQGTQGKTAIGRLNDQGEYFLSTYSPSDGAVVGRHKVIIKNSVENQKTLPVMYKYANLTNPLLSAEVKSGEKNEINFEL